MGVPSLFGSSQACDKALYPDWRKMKQTVVILVALAQDAFMTQGTFERASLRSDAVDLKNSNLGAPGVPDLSVYPDHLVSHLQSPSIGNIKPQDSNINMLLWETCGKVQQPRPLSRYTTSN